MIKFLTAEVLHLCGIRAAPMETPAASSGAFAAMTFDVDDPAADAITEDVVKDDAATIFQQAVAKLFEVTVPEGLAPSKVRKLQRRLLKAEEAVTAAHAAWGAEDPEAASQFAQRPLKRHCKAVRAALAALNAPAPAEDAETGV